MSPARLVSAASAAGITLHVSSSGLVASYSTPVDPALLRTLRTHREALAAHLLASGPAQAPAPETTTQKRLRFNGGQASKRKAAPERQHLVTSEPGA